MYHLWGRAIDGRFSRCAEVHEVKNVKDHHCTSQDQVLTLQVSCKKPGERDGNLDSWMKLPWLVWVSFLGGQNHYGPKSFIPSKGPSYPFSYLGRDPKKKPCSKQNLNLNPYLYWGAAGHREGRRSNHTLHPREQRPPPRRASVPCSPKGRSFQIPTKNTGFNSVYRQFFSGKVLRVGKIYGTKA